MHRAREGCRPRKLPQRTLLQRKFLRSKRPPKPTSEGREQDCLAKKSVPAKKVVAKQAAPKKAASKKAAPKKALPAKKVVPAKKAAA